jgi:hypothetical protein
MVLQLAAELVGLDEARPALLRLAPSPLRRRLLRRLVDDRSLLAMRDITQGPWQFVLQVLLVDRPRDALRLIWRALWPEDEWLIARYGQASRRARWRHLLSAVQGKI